ncbi:MAG: efflux RND transporter periplasmic adaptor subunit, partial [Lachnospiraceae bacterium]|nr:efflux RND transporter periplasmic adaptor subunit [Lachnospiraceae bacterium]
DVLYVSKRAVVTDDDKTYVLVKNEDGSIEKRTITTGFSDGVNIEVVEGLSEGETVLIESKVSK